VRAVCSRNTGGDAVARLDRDSEGGFVPSRIAARHQRQTKLLDPFLAEREADQAASVLGHKIDRVGSRHLRRDDEIALILAILVIDQDEHPAVARLVDQLFGTGKVTPLHQRRSSIIRPR
jgi:hypothetical protein